VDLNSQIFKGGKTMLKKEENRVLIRAGARQLTQDEVQTIIGTGNPLNTFASSLVTGPVTHPDEQFDQ